MSKYKKMAFLFPGQGAQYPGMGKDFVENFEEARSTFEEADEVLSRNLSSIILHGPETTLTETKNSQTGIYVNSLAILRLMRKLFPELKPLMCAGLSLGEYTALTASDRLPFRDGLRLVQQRGLFMNEACESTKGTMAVILGLDAEAVESLVKETGMPHDLWAANFNCPGQVVISGTLKGIEIGSKKALEKGAKRVLPLQVHGAFHSGLMKEAEIKLADYIKKAALQESAIELVMNVTGDFAKSLNEIRENLRKQVTSPVRWQQGVKKMADAGADLFVEIGCGKALSGFIKKMNLAPMGLVPAISIEKVTDLDALYKAIS
jgi:[acyl-carrier-protein] S-malonyltransferase